VKILVTGGAGFIGRWVVKKLLEEHHHVWILDDLSNGSFENIEEFESHPYFREFIKGDIKDTVLLKNLFFNKFDLCYHLAASINVQDSIDYPGTTFANDTIGTFNLLDQCRIHKVKIVFMSTCMVYDQAFAINGIKETDPVKPASPYAGAKLAAENLVMSYYYAYQLPTVIIRPFNTYGPYQKSGGEGGVVAIFIKNKLENKPLMIYGDGTQTRDLLYVEDCASFVVKAGYSKKANGEIIHAGLGQDISINDLAYMIVKNKKQIYHVEHIHPQSEIPKLLSNYNKAKNLLDWKPTVLLENGIQKTEEWLRSNKNEK
jgi:UDP-glucose 4-epimerase